MDSYKMLVRTKHAADEARENGFHEFANALDDIALSLITELREVSARHGTANVSNSGEQAPFTH